MTQSQQQDQYAADSTGTLNGDAARETDAPSSVRGALGLFDAVSIIVGIVVGAGIYQTAPLILNTVDTPNLALVAWGLGGFLSLVGALCYAELASTYPREGGDIVYLSRAFGRWVGFLFGWVQLTVILTGSIGMMAFVFANYATRLTDIIFDHKLDAVASFAFAGGAVFLLTVTNILGVVFGKVVQNILTLAKVIGLIAIVTAGFMAPKPDAWIEPSKAFMPPTFGLAMILILYTYGGWNDAAFVAAEVKNGKKNITRALVLGILVITSLYLLVNAAYINSQGFAGAQQSKQIAADVLNSGFGKNGEALMCVLVMVSALGAVNGLIFTGARVYSTTGKEHKILRWMSGWSRKQGAPVPALLTQGVITLGLIFLVGTTRGRGYMNDLLEWIGLVLNITPIKWGDAPSATDAFNTLLGCTAPVFWLFFLLTGISVFVLRERDRDIERPFVVPFYPELPLLFCISCGYMLYSSTDFALSQGWKGGLFLLGILPLLIGLPLYRLSRLIDPTRGQAERS